MAPKSSLKHTSKQSPQNHGSSTIKDAATASIDYAEVQAEELDVLRAIYMEDYEEVVVKSAWSKTSDHAFRLKLRAFSDDETYVVLNVKLTATYPKTLPLLEVEDLDRLQAVFQQRIQNIVRKRPVELVGEVMIHAIASDIQETLDDAVQSREQGVLPSLEDERVNQETVAEEQAKEAEVKEAKLTQAAQAEEDRLLQQMVQDEVERREAKRKKPLQGSNSEAAEGPKQQDDGAVVFDQVFVPGTDSSATDTVVIVSPIASRADSQISMVQPRLLSTSLPVTLAMRRSSLGLVAGDVSTRNNLLALEEELEALKALRQPNIVNIYAFKIEKTLDEDTSTSPSWNVYVVMDFANRGSLAEMLEDGQTIPVARARQWCLDLLEALDFYHRHGIVHKRIHSRNVLFTRSSSGSTIPKLADAAYEDRILRLQSHVNPNEKNKKLSAWPAPECTGDVSTYTRRSDVWDFGVLIVSMLFGTSITRKYANPDTLLNSLDLSVPLDDVLRKVFSHDSRSRPSAFDLIPSEFFRTEVLVMSSSETSGNRRSSPSIANLVHRSHALRRSRHNSTGASEAAIASRYASDFTELGRLGKGGFGEVVKARNKLDGGVYAIKKVKQDSIAQLEHVLSEIMLLHRLSHAYVVRYYTAWVENDSSGMVELDEESVSMMSMTEDMTLSSSDDCPRMEFGTMSSHGLDFVSSSGYNNIQFGDDDDEDDDNDDSDTDTHENATEEGTASGAGTDRRRGDQRLTSTSDLAVADSSDDEEHLPSKRRSSSRRVVRSTLYIQMEYCERHTLRDLIRKDMYTRPEEGWQMLRQILEGLAHIHSHGIIHRDLKPDNVFIDNVGNPRIGDFGLATTSQYLMADKVLASTNTGGDMTRSVGTALYVAPEVKSASGATYNDKVDMYSLGIIFFEMCFPLRTAMERHQVLLALREKDHSLPTEFSIEEKSLQADVITSLISHVPSERPSSGELLRSGKLPLQIEDDTVRQALQSLSDSASPYYQKMMTALFSQKPEQRIRDYAWDIKIKAGIASAEDLRVRDIARQTLCSVFRRHGAEETQRPLLLPKSSYYTSPNTAQLLDGTGNLLMLPFDLTLPNARQLSRQGPAVARTYVFGTVYRDTLTGGPPRAIAEVDFDITTQEAEDPSLQDAEVIKVVDEIIEEIPALSSSAMCYHVNHSDLLEVIFDYCRIDRAQRSAVKEVLSKLNIHQYNWSKIRAELRSPLLAIHSTSLDDLAQFDFRESPQKIQSSLETILEGSPHVNRLRRPLEYISRVVDNLKMLSIRRKVYVCPLSSINEKFYTGALLFQCIHDKKNRSVFAAGGRYDQLVDAHRLRGEPGSTLYHAVGVSIGFDGLVAAILRHNKTTTSGSTFLKKAPEEGTRSLRWSAKRCEVLIVSSDPTVLHSNGVRLLASLWAADVSAELATEAHTIDDLLSRQRDTTHSFIVIMKHEASSTLRVRNTLTDIESEVATTHLTAHIRSQIRERDFREGVKISRHPALLRHGSSHAEGEKSRSNVQVLLSQHRSKKSNKYHIVEAAQQRWSERVSEWRNAPILAIETRDDVLESIRETRLSDAESWRKLIQSVQLAERQYLGQVHDLLGDMRKKWGEREGGREACVFNFRTGGCIYYDVGL